MKTILFAVIIIFVIGYFVYKKTPIEVVKSLKDAIPKTPVAVTHDSEVHSSSSPVISGSVTVDNTSIAVADQTPLASNQITI